MSTLLFQLVLKQWDKSQRQPEQQTAIASQASIYPINSQPEFMLFEKPCVLDQHALDFAQEPLEDISAELLSTKDAGRAISKTFLKDGRAKLDRFIISHSAQGFHLAYEDEEGVVTEIGSLENGWIQAKYEWRYRVEKNNEIFWQYEEVILNAALVDTVNTDAFLQQPPALVFNACQL